MLIAEYLFTMAEYPDDTSTNLGILLSFKTNQIKHAKMEANNNPGGQPQLAQISAAAFAAKF